MSYVPVADLNIHFEQQGHSADTLFVHGFAGNLNTWDGLWQCWDGPLSGLRYDLRGHGKTQSPPGQAYSHSDDLIGLMDALDLPHCDLVGVSMGGAIALHTALMHPHRVRRLVLISPGLVAWEWSEDWLELWQPIKAAANSGNMEKARHLWWQHPLFESTRNSVGADALHQSIQAYSGQRWLGDSEKDELPDLEHLHLLQVPALLLSGGKDLGEFRLMADLITASSECVKRMDFPDAGHLMHLEQPQRCADAVTAFLRRDKAAVGCC